MIKHDYLQWPDAAISDWLLKYTKHTSQSFDYMTTELKLNNNLWMWTKKIIDWGTAFNVTVCCHIGDKTSTISKQEPWKSTENMWFARISDGYND